MVSGGLETSDVRRRNGYDWVRWSSGAIGVAFEAFIALAAHFLQGLVDVGQDKLPVLGVDAAGGIDAVPLKQVEGTEPVEKLLVDGIMCVMILFHRRENRR